jgi:hypothetical protein
MFDWGPADTFTARLRWAPRTWSPDIGWKVAAPISATRDRGKLDRRAASAIIPSSGEGPGNPTPRAARDNQGGARLSERAVWRVMSMVLGEMPPP